MIKHDKHGYEVSTRTSKARLHGAVKQVIDHYLKAELADYKTRTREEQQAHIFQALRTLRYWLEEQDEMAKAKKQGK